MDGCESWTIKKVECRRIDAFELWCWKRLLRVPWTARRSNQSMLKEISPGSSLEGLMLKLKLQFFGPWFEGLTHWKKLWCWERLKAGRERDDRGWDCWMPSSTWWTWVWVDSGSWRWTGRPGMLWFMGSQRVGHDWATELNCLHCFPIYLSWSDGTGSLSSWGSLVLFAFCHKGGVICISEVIDISPGNPDFSLCFIQPSVSYDVLCM